MSKTYKTWEIWRDVDKLKDREFNCINGLGKTFNEPVKLMNFADAPGLSIKVNDYTHRRIENLTGFEEWELIPKPVDFMTAANSGKEIYPEGYYHSDDLKGWLCYLIAVDNNERLELLNGKWFIKEE